MTAAAASMAVLAFTYYGTSAGIPALDLTQQDLAEITTGALKGALHTNDIDVITTCVAQTTTGMDEVKDKM
jgi:hypothetical protein